MTWAEAFHDVGIALAVAIAAWAFFRYVIGDK